MGRGVRMVRGEKIDLPASQLLGEFGVKLFKAPFALSNPLDI